MPSQSTSLQFNTVEETIGAFKNGEFIVVLDSQDRENEGDLIIAADSITPAKMAFMIRYSSGVICAPILPELCERLELPQMVTNNADPNRTAYTITIDSNDPSVTTGISATDRSLTCRTLAVPDVQPSHFRRPGHVLPLKARAGGVRERRGHTEAAVDLCRLAGKVPAAAIAELVEEAPADAESSTIPERADHDMMRRDGCLRFGKRFGVKVCTIDDMVQYLEKTGEPVPVVNGKA